MTDPRLDEDSQARQRALEARSFIVEAPAGAGKTELLTQRYLALLAGVEHPEEVLALTFTNKAATEMRDRILGSLAIAVTGNPPEAAHKHITFTLARQVLARDATLGWGLLAHPGRLRITTFDALSASLARQMPMLSRFGAQPGVAPDADAHYRQAARLTLALVEGKDDAAATLAHALDFFDNQSGRLESLIADMLKKRDQWLRYHGRLDDPELRAEVEGGLALLAEKAIADAARQLDAGWQARLQPLIRFAASQLPPEAPLQRLRDWAAPLAGDASALADWQTLAGALLTTQDEFRLRLDKNAGFPADKAAKPHKEAMQALLGELAPLPGLAAALGWLRVLPAPRQSDAEWADAECFAHLLTLAAAQLWLVFQEAGEVDFSEIALRAMHALGEEGEPTDLAQALDYRIRHLLVDEFQDTSPLQVTLLEGLTRGWQPDDGRSLFLVGDPMQSIYRFRKAEVGLFLEARASGLGGIPLEHLRLYRNNRSLPAVVDWVNTTFPHILPTEDAAESGAVRYSPCAATRPPEADSGVSFHPVFAREGSDPDSEEAARLLALIREAHARHPDERVAVLVSARSHLHALVELLRRSAPDLPFQAVEIEALAERQAIQDLLSLQLALWHRADRVHWLAILRAPWCGLSLADLHALAGSDHQQTLWQLINDPACRARLSGDGQQRLAHLQGVLAPAFAQRLRQPPRRWLEGIWLQLGGPHCLEGPAALADVQVFFALIDELAAAGQLDGDTLQQRIADLFAPPDPQADERLQLMTIHKSKGLEFETVILPGLHKSGGQDSTPLLRWDSTVCPDGRPHLLLGPLPRPGQSGPSVFELLRRLESRRAAHEDGRLLYVAATRAIRRLHLLAVLTPDPGKPDGVVAPRKGTALAQLWDSYAREQTAIALAHPDGLGGMPPDATAGQGNALFVPRLFRLLRPQVPAATQAVREAPDAANEDAPPLPEATSPTLPAAVGTLVHRYLELIARDGLGAWNAERLERCRRGASQWLSARGFTADEALTGAEACLQALRTTLHSEDGRWVLGQRLEAVAEECWLSRESAEGGSEGAWLRQHVIDRSFVADGVRWIIDYKTLQQLPPMQTLETVAAGHRGQLERYAGLYRQAGLPLKMGIYFPVQGKLVELD